MHQSIMGGMTTGQGDILYAVVYVRRFEELTMELLKGALLLAKEKVIVVLEEEEQVQVGVCYGHLRVLYRHLSSFALMHKKHRLELKVFLSPLSPSIANLQELVKDSALCIALTEERNALEGQFDGLSSNNSNGLSRIPNGTNDLPERHSPSILAKPLGDLSFLPEPFVGMRKVFIPCTNPHRLNDPGPVDKMLACGTGHFACVALGGTFDRLHGGHKLLLSVGVLLARERLICGVANVGMLQSKAFGNLIQPLQQRLDEAERFLRSFAPSTLQIEMVVLDDPYGPTVVDPNIEALVLTPETRPVGMKINNIRAERQLAPMAVISIDFVELDPIPGMDHCKLSSTLLRSLDSPN